MGQPVKLSDELVDDARAVVPSLFGVLRARSSSARGSENRSSRCFVAIGLFRCKWPEENVRFRNSYRKSKRRKVARGLSLL